MEWYQCSLTVLALLVFHQVSSELGLHWCGTLALYEKKKGGGGGGAMLVTAALASNFQHSNYSNTDNVPANLLN